MARCCGPWSTSQGKPPSERSWRYRRDGAPRLFAIVGVVIGFAALVVPGVVALRSYRRWQDETADEPTFAWSMAVVGLVAIPVVPLYMVLPIVAVGLALIVGVSMLFLVGPRH